MQHTFVLSILMLVLSAPAFAGSVSELSIEVISLGVAQVENRGSISAMELLEGAPAPLEITQRDDGTPRVPAVLGSQFGYRYKLTGPREGANWLLHFVVRHPAMKNPKKSGSTNMHSYDAGVSTGETRFDGYKFSKEYEMVPGEWVFEMYEQDNLLHSMTFEVFLP